MEAPREQYDVYFRSGLYHSRYPSANSCTLHTILQCTTKDARLLDFGCGIGRYSIAILPHCSSLVSYDISHEALSLLGKRLIAVHPALRRYCLLTSDIDVTKQHAPYDVVLCLFGVLSHLVDVAQRRDTLLLLRSVIAPGGTLIVSVPNRLRRFYIRQFINFVSRKETASIRYTRPGIPGHLPYFLYTPTALNDELRLAGFTVISTRPESLLPEQLITNIPGLSALDCRLGSFLSPWIGYGIITVATHDSL
jgi:tRNA (uracil-5-)-methyltransferase TRM9